MVSSTTSSSSSATTMKRSGGGSGGRKTRDAPSKYELEAADSRATVAARLRARENKPVSATAGYTAEKTSTALNSIEKALDGDEMEFRSSTFAHHANGGSCGPLTPVLSHYYHPSYVESVFQRMQQGFRVQTFLRTYPEAAILHLKNDRTSICISPDTGHHHKEHGGGDLSHPWVEIPIDQVFKLEFGRTGPNAPDLHPLTSFSIALEDAADGPDVLYFYDFETETPLEREHLVSTLMIVLETLYSQNDSCAEIRQENFGTRGSGGRRSQEKDCDENEERDLNADDNNDGEGDESKMSENINDGMTVEQPIPCSPSLDSSSPDMFGSPIVGNHHQSHGSSQTANQESRPKNSRDLDNEVNARGLSDGSVESRDEEDQYQGKYRNEEDDYNDEEPGFENHQDDNITKTLTDLYQDNTMRQAQFFPEQNHTEELYYDDGAIDMMEESESYHDPDFVAVLDDSSGPPPHDTGTSFTTEHSYSSVVVQHLEKVHIGPDPPLLVQGRLVSSPADRFEPDNRLLSQRHTQQQTHEEHSNPSKGFLKIAELRTNRESDNAPPSLVSEVRHAPTPGNLRSSQMLRALELRRRSAPVTRHNLERRRTLESSRALVRSNHSTSSESYAYHTRLNNNIRKSNRERPNYRSASSFSETSSGTFYTTREVVARSNSIPGFMHERISGSSPSKPIIIDERIDSRAVGIYSEQMGVEGIYQEQYPEGFGSVDYYERGDDDQTYSTYDTEVTSLEKQPSIMSPQSYDLRTAPSQQLVGPWCSDDVCTTTFNDMAQTCSGMFTRDQVKHSQAESSCLDPRFVNDQMGVVRGYVNNALGAPSTMFGYFTEDFIPEETGGHAEPTFEGPTNRVQNRAALRNAQAGRYRKLRKEMNLRQAQMHPQAFMRIRTTQSFNDAPNLVMKDSRAKGRMRLGKPPTGKAKIDEEVAYYDSDPEDTREQTLHRGPRRVSAEMTEQHINHPQAEKTRPAFGKIRNKLSRKVDEELVKQIVQVMQNDRLNLMWHPTQSPDQPNRAPAVVRLWIESGLQLQDGTFLLPKLSWTKVTDETGFKKSELYKLDLLDITRIRATEKIDRTKHPFASRRVSFVVESQKDIYLFEAETADERDRVVYGLKIVVARLASLLMLRDYRAAEEFFGSSSNMVPGESPI